MTLVLQSRITAPDFVLRQEPSDWRLVPSKHRATQQHIAPVTPMRILMR